MKKIIIFLLIVFFLESNLKTIKWSKLSQIGPKLHKTSKTKIKINIAKKIELAILIFENNRKIRLKSDIFKIALF